MDTFSAIFNSTFLADKLIEEKKRMVKKSEAKFRRMALIIIGFIFLF